MLAADETTLTRPVDATAGWADVCGLAQLEPLWAEAAIVDGEQLAIVLMPSGTVYAVSNRDPATGSFVMCRGIVGSRGDRDTLASPLHKQVYDLATGECFSSADLTLPTFETRIESGTVQVRLAPEATATHAA
jgi:nitrite reductase (NADH) small subunit